MHFKKIYSGLYIFACACENPYPQTNIPHLACVYFIDYVTLTIGLWSLPIARQAVCQPQLHLDLLELRKGERWQKIIHCECILNISVE